MEDTTTPPTQPTEIERLQAQNEKLKKEIEDLHMKTTKLRSQVDALKPLVDQHERELGHWDLSDDPKVLEALWGTRPTQEYLYSAIDRSIEEKLLARRAELLQRKMKPSDEVAVIGDLVARRREVEEEQEWVEAGMSRWKLKLLRRWRKLRS